MHVGDITINVIDHRSNNSINNKTVEYAFPLADDVFRQLPLAFIVQSLSFRISSSSMMMIVP